MKSSHKASHINIAFGIDQGALKLLFPAIISILVNKNDTTSITIYILEQGLNDSDYNEINNLNTYSKVNNCEIKLIKLHKNEYKFPDIPNKMHKKPTSATFYRLILPSLLKNLDRILYLDADIIVRGDLLNFYQQDLGNNYCALLKDDKEKMQAKVVVYNNGETIKEFFNINAGVILFNIIQIIQNKKHLELVSKMNHCYKLPNYLDQDIIADTFCGNIAPIENKYNFILLTCDNLRVLNRSTKKEYKNIAQNHSVIMHYAASLKPANFNKIHKLPLNHSYYKEFYKYFQMSCLKLHPVKLRVVFFLAFLRRVRRYIAGVKSLNQNKKTFYFLNMEIIIRRYKVENIESNLQTLHQLKPW